MEIERRDGKKMLTVVMGSIGAILRLAVCNMWNLLSYWQRILKNFNDMQLAIGYYFAL